MYMYHVENYSQKRILQKHLHKLVCLYFQYLKT